ncbi:FHA domain-containing protein [Pseudomonas sp. Marseille-QA0892]
MLKLQFSDNRQAPLWLVKPCLTLGRDPRNDVVLHDEGVDDFHAEIRDELGTYYLSDTDSQGGTFVNGERVEARYALQAGDRVQIGAAELQLVDPVRADSTPATGRWYLHVLSSGEHEGRKYHINGTMTFGRSIRCDMCFSDMALSRRHCEFYLRDDMLEMRDLGSANGVLLNQQPVAAATLKPGDELQMGSVTLLVIGPKPPEIESTDEDATLFMRAADLPKTAPRPPLPRSARRRYRVRPAAPDAEPISNEPPAPTSIATIALVALCAAAVVTVVGAVLVWLS